MDNDAAAPRASEMAAGVIHEPGTAGIVSKSRNQQGPMLVIAVDGEHAYIVYCHFRRARAEKVRDEQRARYAGTGVRFHCARAYDFDRWKTEDARLVASGIVAPDPRASAEPPPCDFPAEVDGDGKFIGEIYQVDGCAWQKPGCPHPKACREHGCQHKAQAEGEGDDAAP